MIPNPLVFVASKFATVYHNGQTRGSMRAPYVTHCFDVAGRLVQAGIDLDEVVAAAILHDVVEDTFATHEMILSTFGPEVSKLVLDLTLPDECKKNPQKTEWQVAKVSEMSEFGMAIKVADKTSNVCDLRVDPPSWGKRALLGYTVDAKQVVDAVRMRKPTLPGLVRLLGTFEEEYAASLKKYG